MAELSVRPSDFSVIADAELDSLVERIVSMHPQAGEKTSVEPIEEPGLQDTETKSVGLNSTS